MNSPISWPHAFRAHLSRPSWPVVLLLMAGLHLWLLVWSRSLTPPPGTAAMQNPQVRWLQATVLPAAEPAPQTEGLRMEQSRRPAPPQPQHRPRPTTAPPEPINERAPPRTPDPMPLHAPLPRNDAPTPEAPATPASPQAAAPTAKDSPTTPATPPAAPAAPAPSAAPARPVDARTFGCDFPRPPYPRLARLNGESGTAVIHLTLAASGQVATAALERSSGFAALDAAALASARAGQCTPGASARLATVPFHFQLEH